MTFNFVKENFHIGQASPDLSPQFIFYKRGFNIGSGGSQPSWKDIILKGNTALTLVNAKANGLNYLKLFGKCEQTGTPTPDNLIDIVCNNGTIKFKHQSGLPLGFTLLEYIEADGNQQLNTGVKIASTDVAYSEFANSSSSGYGALYGIYQSGESSAFYANGTYYGYDETNQKVNTNVSIDTNWHTVTHDFVNGTLTLDDTTATFTPFTFENSTDNYLFSRYYNGSYGYGFKGKCRKHIITRGLTTRCNLLPVMRDSDSELGMYDIQNDVFCPNIGSGDFVGGNPVSDPVIMYTDGTTETVKDSLNNTAVAEMLLSVGDVKDVQSVLDGNVTRKVGVKVLDGTENYVKRSDYAINYSGLTDRVYSVSDYGMCSHFVCSANNASTAPIGSLFFNVSNNYLHFFTEYGGDVASFKAWLTAQYNAGTPVTIVYPLATPTTESVESQALTIQAGTNIVEITQASIDNLGLEVSYKQLI